MTATPPPELVEQWGEDWYRSKVKHTDLQSYIVAKAVQWGADQELEACCEILRGEFNYHHLVEPLRAARRPKPLSLKEQALIHFESFAATFETSGGDSDLIRRALEQLPDHEPSGNSR